MVIVPTTTGKSRGLANLNAEFSAPASRSRLRTVSAREHQVEVRLSWPGEVSADVVSRTAGEDHDVLSDCPAAVGPAVSGDLEVGTIHVLYTAEIHADPHRAYWDAASVMQALSAGAPGWVAEAVAPAEEAPAA